MIFSDVVLPDPKIFMSLIPKQDRNLFERYLQYIYLLVIRAKHPNMQKRFNNIRKAVSHTWSDKSLLGSLQKDFIRKNLSLSLLLEPIDGVGRLSFNPYKLKFYDAVPILMPIVMPISRMIAVLNNQRPPFYQPFADLLFGYWVLYNITNDERRLTLSEYKITLDEKSSKAVIMRMNEETSQLMFAVFGLSFRLKIGFYLGLFNILGQKIYKHTPKDKKNIKISEYVNAILYGLWQTLRKRNKLTDLNKV